MVLNIDGVRVPIGIFEPLYPKFRKGLVMNDLNDHLAIQLYAANRIAELNRLTANEIPLDDPFRMIAARQVCRMNFERLVERRRAQGADTKTILAEINAIIWVLELAGSDPNLVLPENAPEASYENRCSA